MASITTKPDTRELTQRSLEQQGYELSPECESMLELLTEDIVVGVYEAYCANARRQCRITTTKRLGRVCRLRA